MNLQEKSTSCPYCGEPLTLLVDPSEGDTQYTEDCQVCCRPMLVDVAVDFEGDTYLSVKREDE
ncbi:MAG: CPXCG motif-containing cysteine-rich protein [Congregibacter sp.]